MKLQTAASLLIGGAVAIPGSIPCACSEKTVTMTVTEPCSAPSLPTASAATPATTATSLWSSTSSVMETPTATDSSSSIAVIVTDPKPSSSVIPSTGPSTTASSSSASSSTGVSEACDNNDDAIWTRENYSENDISAWYNYWYKENIEGDDQIDETFAAYWGLGPSFSCDITNQCAAPQCSALKRPDQAYDYENAAMFLASMSNFNAHYSKIYESLDGAKIDFGSIEATLQQTFYPGVTKADMAAIQGLSGGQAAIGIMSAWSGPASPFVNTFKEIYGGVSRGFSAFLKASDKSVQNIASLEENFTGKMDNIRKTFAEIHDNVLKWGVHNFTMIDSIFEGGSYVDDREIAILHDISNEDLRDYIREQMFAMIINQVWLKQGAYILSRPMDDADCKEYSVSFFEDIPDHLCYDNRIYWLYKYRGATAGATSSVNPLPGSKEDLEKHVGITTQDAMLSAIKGYNEGGYKYDSAADVDHLFEGDIQEKIDLKSRIKGFWSFPICEIETSDEFDTTGLQQEEYGPTSVYWSTVDHNRPAGKGNKGSDGIQMCLCATAKDRQGVSIKELENPGPDSFRAILDAPEHQACNLKNKLTFN